MIVSYQRKFLVLGISGLLLQAVLTVLASVLAPTDLADKHSLVRPGWIETALGVGVYLSMILWILGLGYYAKAKGYSGLLGIAGILSCVGFLPLALLHDRTVGSGGTTQPIKSGETPNEPAGGASAVARPALWDFRQVVVALIAGSVLQGFLFANLSNSRFEARVSEAEYKFALAVDLLVLTRTLVAYVRKEQGNGWVFYSVLCYTSFIWIAVITRLAIWIGNRA